MVFDWENGRQLESITTGEEFCEFLDKNRITEEQYWNDQVDKIKKDLSISDYINSLKKIS